MIAVIVVGSILTYILGAFIISALVRPIDPDDTGLFVWLIGFWPITVPVIAACFAAFGIICGLVWCAATAGIGIAKLGSYYTDFLKGT
jgi:hypothetical protein